MRKDKHSAKMSFRRKQSKLREFLEERQFQHEKLLMKKLEKSRL